MRADLSAAAIAVPEATSGPCGRSPRGYLAQFDLYRVIACASVVGQHAFLWTVAPGNGVAWGFVMLLHFSRYSFFFLSAVVVCYAQITRPRSLQGFWRRRYVQIGVPYLAWTGIYFVFTLLSADVPAVDAPRLLGSDLVSGYYQLYFVVVLFQFYLVVPPLLWLLRRTRRHWLILSVSVAFALFLSAAMHYSDSFGPIGDAMRSIGWGWPWSRNILTYQAFFVAGALVAYHLDWVLTWVERLYRQVIALSIVIGAATVLWYVVWLQAGETTGRASDLFQPVAVVWFGAAIAGLFCLGWWWSGRGSRWSRSGRGSGPAGRRARRVLPSVAVLAELTGGIYLSHVLFINLIRSALGATGLRAHLSWVTTTVILFAATVVVAAAFVALVLRTPLRWVLGGPVRAEQRALCPPVTGQAPGGLPPT